MPATDIDTLISQFRTLGVQRGDIIYARAKLSSVGRVHPPSSQTILDALLEVLGSDGTLLVPAFTDTNFRFARRKTKFNPRMNSNTGALSRLVLNNPSRLRSTHPTHSFAAIGPASQKILYGHNEKSSAFFPMKALMDLGGKMLLLGCVTESPGFSTVHYVQYELGLSQRHYTRLLFETVIDTKDGEIIWRPIEDPGCSLGFGKLYPDYREAAGMAEGRIGKAIAFLLDARKAYEVEKSALVKDPLAVICDRPSCISCRVLRGYNKRAAPLALTRWIIEHLGAKRAA